MKVVLFDGVCNLCNATIQFIIKKDHENEFKFASLQSKFGASFLKENGLNEKDFTTMILVEDDVYYTKSEAALRIFRRLKGYKWMGVFLIIPKFLRNAVYSFVSRNRYALFGKQEESCMLPTKELTSKFILDVD